MNAFSKLMQALAPILRWRGLALPLLLLLLLPLTAARCAWQGEGPTAHGASDWIAATDTALSRMDMEPVAMELLACASSVALRPSQPIGAFPAWPSPMSGCDLRDVSLPESLTLRASVTTQPSSGK